MSCRLENGSGNENSRLASGVLESVRDNGAKARAQAVEVQRVSALELKLHCESRPK